MFSSQKSSLKPISNQTNCKRRVVNYYLSVVRLVITESILCMVVERGDLLYYNALKKKKTQSLLL